MGYRYQRLDNATIPAFAPLMYERYRPYLTGEKSSDKLIVIGAYQLWQPVGVILGTFDGEQGSLPAVVVHPAHQKQGIATELIRLLEAALWEAGCTSLSAVYLENPPLERVFAKRGWAEPEVVMMTVECQFEPFRASPVYQNAPALPEGYELFTWGTLTADDRAAILARESQPGGWYSRAVMGEFTVSPFIQEERLEPNCSVGLRYHGDVIGWMIVHKLREDTVNFISLFLSPEHRRSSLGIALVMAAVQRYYDIYEKVNPNMHAFWQYDAHNEPMRRLCEQYLLPFAVSHQRELRSICRTS